jgi:amino acid adenylation domain-containing protein
VLQVERVGRHDNFFALGGHSLVAAQAVARIRAACRVELPLRALFEAPTIAALAGRLEAERHEARGQPPAPPLVPVPRDGPLPLSFGQERLWFLDQLAPGGAVYSIPGALRIEGRLDVAALERSLQEIVRRHEALRTRFVSIQGQPRQVIDDEVRLELPVVDLRGRAGEERAARWMREEAQRPFDLARGPLVRAALLRLGPETHVLLLTMHHIVSDDWSLGLLMREASVLYEAFLAGRPSPLGELPLQYGDFSAWQRSWLTGEVLEARLHYWTAQLAALAPLELPTDRPRPAVPSYRGAHRRLEVAPEVVAGLRALSRRQSVTLYMTLLAAFQTLLSRYTGQVDIAVGSPVAARTRTETEGLIGFFVNTLVLRTDLSGKPSFGEVLRRVREVTLAAYAHQELPFEKLVEALAPRRDLSRSPLMQVMFILQNAPQPGLRLGEARLRPLDVETGSAKFDLTLALEEAAGGLQGWVEYSTDLFEAATIDRLVEHYQTLLAEVVAQPEAPIAALRLLTEAERSRLLQTWNATAAAYPDRCIHELVEAQVERTPDAPALVYEEREVGYADLNQRANRLAHYLRKLGVGPEVPVGILADRSVEMVVGLLGILKAGGAYVPLDPQYPRERLRFMLEDAAARVLLTQAFLIEALPEHPVRLVYLDADWDAIAQESGENCASGVTPDNLAYVLHTSGSTGRPKGAMLPHRGVANCLFWMQETYRLDETDRFLMKTSLNFDPSVWEVFWPLMVGARTVLARPDGHLDNAYLRETVDRRGITSVYFVPSMLAPYLETSGTDATSPLRRVICGGEKLPVETVRRFSERMTAELHHSYGPTETSIAVTEWTCPQGYAGATVPMGRPLANTRIYVLDPEMQLLPVGVGGELYVGGAGVGRGYIGRPDLTAERFVPDPFGGASGARLYRTGDLVRWRGDGTLEFLGRLDHQVKLRGFRIELGEIEAVLREHRALRDAAVLLREDSPGDRRLVAYVVPCEETAAGESESGRGAGLPLGRELRRWVAQRLPDYMVPSAFVALDRLPLTPNGKLDRGALPATDGRRAEDGDQYVAPRTPLERELAELWAELLKVERVGVYDNFFELGGHSLLATRLVARIRAACRVELPLRALFEAPTIDGLAAAIGEEQPGREEKTASVIPALHRGEANLDELLAELDELSDDEAESLLADEPTTEEPAREQSGETSR